MTVNVNNEITLTPMQQINMTVNVNNETTLTQMQRINMTVNVNNQLKQRVTTILPNTTAIIANRIGQMFPTLSIVNK